MPTWLPFRTVYEIASLPMGARNNELLDSRFRGNDIEEGGNDIEEDGNDRLGGFFTAMPMRSESGSVAIRISALTFLPNLIASSKAAGYSGLGDSTVEKSGSGRACSSTTNTLVNPLSFNIFLMGTFPAP